MRTHTDRHTDTHINTMIWPGLRAGPSEKLDVWYEKKLSKFKMIFTMFNRMTVLVIQITGLYSWTFNFNSRSLTLIALALLQQCLLSCPWLKEVC